MLVNEVRDFVVDYIQREYTIPDDVDIMSLNYVEEGYIDSLGLFQFIGIIEDEFGIYFTDDELASSNIKIIGQLVDLVVSKMEDMAK